MDSSLNLTDLPNYVLKYVIKFIDNTNDYNNLRLVNKKFLKLMDICKKYNSEGKIMKIYTFLNNNIFGDSYEWYSNDKLKKVTKYNLKGLKHSFHKDFYDNGKIKKICFYNNGVKNGMEKHFFYNGILKRQIIYKNGVKVDNEYINYTNGNSKIISKQISDNYKSIKIYFNNICLINTFLLNNIIHGSTFIYSKKGFLKSIYCFNDGNINGRVVKYKNNNINEIINYKNNIKQGKYCKFNQVGKVNILANFNQGKLEGIMKVWDFSNICTYKIPFKNGLVNGECVQHNIQKKVYNVVNNTLTGYYKEYYFNKVIKLKIKFERNKFDNIYIRYNNDGSVCSEYFFNKSGYRINLYLQSNKKMTLIKYSDTHYIVLLNRKKFTFRINNKLSNILNL